MCMWFSSGLAATKWQIRDCQSEQHIQAHCLGGRRISMTKGGQAVTATKQEGVRRELKHRIDGDLLERSQPQPCLETEKYHKCCWCHVLFCLMSKIMVDWVDNVCWL